MSGVKRRRKDDERACLMQKAEHDRRAGHLQVLLERVAGVAQHAPVHRRAVAVGHRPAQLRRPAGVGPGRDQYFVWTSM